MPISDSIPVNNGEILRIVVPALTEERRRKMLVKQVKGEGENAKGKHSQCPEGCQ
jgi:ribosome recycling factor